MRCCHAAGVLTETTAELAASLTFAAARRVVEADRYMRKGLYLGWAPTLMVGQLLQVRQLPALLRAQVLHLPQGALLTTDKAQCQESAAKHVTGQTRKQVLKHVMPGIEA